MSSERSPEARRGPGIAAAAGPAAVRCRAGRGFGGGRRSPRHRPPGRGIGPQRRGWFTAGPGNAAVPGPALGRCRAGRGLRPRAPIAAAPAVRPGHRADAPPPVYLGTRRGPGIVAVSGPAPGRCRAGRGLRRRAPGRHGAVRPAGHGTGSLRAAGRRGPGGARPMPSWPWSHARKIGCELGSELGVRTWVRTLDFDCANHLSFVCYQCLSDGQLRHGPCPKFGPLCSPSKKLI